MALFRYANSALEPVERTAFVLEQIRERDHLQRALRENIAILDENLLVVAEEYALFQDSRRRIDLLALDRSGSLVVIELKRTEDGGHMELQALRYAAMVSTMTSQQLVDTYAHYHSVESEAARQVIEAHVQDLDQLETLSNRVAIVLVSANFSTEVTSTVLWLNDNYGSDIRCFRLAPYRLGTEVLLDVQQIIPLPEATDYQIQQRHKTVAEASTRESNTDKDYTKYDLTINSRSWPRLSKQASVKTAVRELFRAGVDLAIIRTATQAHRWGAIHPVGGETVIEAFRREFPNRAINGRWYDLDIVDDAGQHWVMPRYGGLDTEPMLTALAEAAGPGVVLTWQRAEV